jgi:Cys-rich repeat protein
MKLIYILALLLVVGSAFAQYCASSSDCGSGEYCDTSTYTCKSYYTSTSSSSGCCGPAAVLGLVLVGAVFMQDKPKLV